MTNIPKTMKACIVTGYGNDEEAIEKNIQMCQDWPLPSVPPGSQNSKIKEDYLLIRVLACALAPGDARVLSGQTDFVQGLPLPYVLGGDTSGIVVAVVPGEGDHKITTKSKFQVGDYVVSRFELPRPFGGCAEYQWVKTRFTELCPRVISPVESCGLTASAMAAKRIVGKYVKGDNCRRLLVIGGSGAVGTSVLQYAKRTGSVYIVAVSTQSDLCSKFGADRVIDYRNEEWWNVADFRSDPFDVVIDLVGGENWIMGGCSGNALNHRGVYVSLVPGVQTPVLVHGLWDLVKLTWEWFARTLYSSLHPKLPLWVVPDGLQLQDGDLSGLLQDVEQGRIQPVLDQSSPYCFTETGIREAMRLQRSCHAHGKVVIKVAEK